LDGGFVAEGEAEASCRWREGREKKPKIEKEEEDEGGGKENALPDFKERTP